MELYRGIAPLFSAYKTDSSLTMFVEHLILLKFYFSEFTQFFSYSLFNSKYSLAQDSHKAKDPHTGLSPGYKLIPYEPQ